MEIAESLIRRHSPSKYGILYGRTVVERAPMEPNQSSVIISPSKDLKSWPP